MWIAGIVLVLVAVGLVMVYRSQKHKLGAMEATETSTVEFLESLAKSMAEGVGAGSLNYFTEVKGEVVCDEALVSELAKVSCVYYSMRVEREYEETYYETDEKGNRHRRTRRGFDTLSQNKRSVPFYVKDATGRIRVEPQGAEIVSEKVHSHYEAGEGRHDNVLRVGNFSINLSGMGLGGDRRILGYRFEEEAIPVGSDIYVLGEATDRNGALCVQGSTEKDNKFIVSTKKEEELVREGRSAMKLSLAGAVACGVIGIALFIIGLVKH